MTSLIKHILILIIASSLVWLAVPRLKAVYVQTFETKAGQTANRQEMAPYHTVDPQASPIDQAIASLSSTVETIADEIKTPESMNSEGTARPDSMPDEAPQWAVAMERAAGYDATGHLSTQLPAGSILHVHSYRRRDKGGDLALCSLDQDGEPRDENLYFLVKQLQIQGFPLSKATGAGKRRLSRYYEIQARIKQRREDLREAAVSNNPHTKAYKTILNQYNAFVENVAALRRERKSATGKQRSEITEELHAMVKDVARLDKERKRLKRLYDAWKHAHGLSVEDDPRTKRLINEQQRIRSLLE